MQTRLLKSILSAPFAVVLLLSAGLASPAAAAPPEVTLDPFPARTNDTTPSVSGDRDSGFPVQVSLLQGATVVRGPYTATVAGPHWSFTLTDPLTADGTYTVEVEQTDGTETGTAADTFTLDTSAPALVVAEPIDGAHLPDPTPLLSGVYGSEAFDEAEVEVEVSTRTPSGEPDESRFSDTLTPGDGLDPTTHTWSAIVGPPLADGDYVLEATQSDDFQERTIRVPFQVDSTAPAPTLTAPADGSASSDRTPVFTGGAGSAASDMDPVIELHPGAASPCSLLPPVPLATVDADKGTFSVTPAADLAPGVYVAYAVQRDSALNCGASSPLTFEIDVTAPAPALTAPSGRVGSGDPTFSGSAGNDTTGPSTDAAAVTITLSDGPTAVAPFTLARSGIAFSGGLPGATTLADGTYTARVTQTDSAGNESSDPTGTTFTVDTAGPTPVIDSPGAGSSTSDATPTIEGEAGTAAGDELGNDAVTVTIRRASDNGVVQSEPVDASPSGEFHLTADALVDGAYTVTATQFDDVGNGGSSGEVTFSVDTQPPAPTLTVPADGTLTNETRPTFAGIAGTEPGDSSTELRITIHSSDANGGAGEHRVLTADPDNDDGEYSVAPATALPDGLYIALAEQDDGAGNTGPSSPTISFRIDTAAPQPTLESPAVGSAINLALPTFSGTGGQAASDDPTVTVEIRDDGGALVLSRVAALAADGSYSVGAAPTALTDGDYSATVTQGDGAGNAGSSPPTGFTVDTTPPVVSLQQFAGDEPALTGDAAPTFHGHAEVAAPPDTAAVELRVYRGTDLAAPPVRTAAMPGDTGGDYALTISPELPDGVFTALTRQRDRAGNEGFSAPFTFTVDTIGPTVLVNEPAAGTILADRTPVIAGAAEPGTVTLDLHEGATTGGAPARSIEAAANSQGDFAAVVAPPLGDGRWTLVAREDDPAGNPGSSTPLTFQVDTGPPQVTLEPPFASGSSADRMPTLRGGAEEGPVTVTISVGSAVLSDPSRVVRTAAGPEGRYSVELDQPLADGVHTLQAEQRDAAGNVGRSSPITIEIDATPPAPAVHGPADRSFLPTALPTVSGRAGRADSDGATVDITLSGPITVGLRAARDRNGAFIASSGRPLPDGLYTVTARQSDATGNVGTSPPVLFVVDTRVPETLIKAGPVPLNGGTRNIVLEFGADEEVAEYRCRLDGDALRGPCETPLTLRRLRAGRHRFSVRAIDRAGNQDASAATLSFLIDVSPPRMGVSKALRETRSGRAALRLTCPGSQAVGPCAGRLSLRRGRSNLLTRSARFRIPVGKRATVAAPLKRRYRQLLRRRDRLRVSVRLVAADGRGNVGRRTLRRTLQERRR